MRPGCRRRRLQVINEYGVYNPAYSLSLRRGAVLGGSRARGDATPPRLPGRGARRLALGPRRRGASAARRGDGVRLDAVAALERDDSTNAPRAVPTASALTTPQHIDDDRKEVICEPRGPAP